jgi:hypothetical protein
MTSSRDHWAAALAEQESSGLSIVRFCKRRGIALSTFHSWRSRLRRFASSFVEAIVPASGPASAPSVPIVELRCGRRVAVPSGFDAHDLARLLRLVESLDREERR